MEKSWYQAGFCLPLDAPTYVERAADEALYQGLKAGELCDVLDSPQTGKSSLRVRTAKRLEASGFACASLSLRSLGTTGVTSEQWYFGIIDSLVDRLRIESLSPGFDVGDWWEGNPHLSAVQRFANFLSDVLLVAVSEPVVIFFDEIDSVLNLAFDTNDFFAVIQAYDDKRSEHPKSNRLTFALMGVATPTALIKLKPLPLFCNGREVQLTGFKFWESSPLLPGLAEKFSHPEAVLEAVLRSSQGQPFLTQKVCQLVTEEVERSPATWVTNGSDLVDYVMRTQIVPTQFVNCESEDEDFYITPR